MSNWFRENPKLAFFSALLVLAGIAFWRCLPDPLFQEPLSTVLFDRNGQLLGAKISDDEQWRFPYSGKIPEKFKRAIVAYEDKRFFSHPGFDPLALARSIRMNISQGRVVSGGSTISMQVIRLSRKNPRRTYLEKLKEIILALRLELRYSKEEILALYSSYAPFGGNTVGLEAAAWRYFGRSADQLSWAESCMLAVLPNSPSMIHPGKNRVLLKNKRDELIKRLNLTGVIDNLESKLAMAEPLPKEPVPIPRSALHLLETLRLQVDDHQYRLESTLYGDLQTATQEIVSQHSKALGQQGIKNAAALVVDNESFEVLAYVGNSDYSPAYETGYAVDIVRRPRSTGSILKPLLFATMIEQGEILPESLVADVPTRYRGYMPENYDRRYRGAVPAKVALARSLNVPAVRMLNKYGLDRFYDFLRQMNMTTLYRPPEEYGLTLILGGAEGTLWDMTSMYANLANIANGNIVAGKATYKTLKTLKSDETSSDRPVEIGSAAAWITMNSLLEVSRPGNEGYWKKFSSSMKVAWKTGTSYGFRDGWAIGSTPGYTVGVWVGNASGEGKPGLIGVAAAAPILFDIFNRLGSSGWFVRPDDQMKDVAVCEDDGYLANEYCKSETQLIPAVSHFDQSSPYHRLIHLDKTETWQVHGSCESVDNMVHKRWFILPPGQEFYYRRHHPEYRTLPPFREDCRPLVAANGNQGPIELIYPGPGTKLYIPVDLGGERGNTIFEAVHRDKSATLFWHLDDRYLGATNTFHQQALDIKPGLHRLVVVDNYGNRLARRFEVLGMDRAAR